jgi:hypothetical protein
MKLLLATSTIGLAALTSAHGIVNFNFSSPTQVSSTLYRYTDVDGTNSTDMYLSYDNIGGSGSITKTADSTIGNSVAIRSLTGLASNDPFVEFTLKFVQSGDDFSDSAKSISNLNMQFFDIDSDNGIDFTDVVGYDSSLSGDVLATSFGATTNLEQAGFANTTSGTGYTTYRMDPATAGDPTNWFSEENVDQSTAADLIEQEAYTVSVTFTSFSEGSFIAGFTGGDSSTRNRGFAINMSNPPLINVIPEPSAAAGVFALAGLLIARRRR